MIYNYPIKIIIILYNRSVRVKVCISLFTPSRNLNGFCVEYTGNYFQNVAISSAWEEMKWNVGYIALVLKMDKFKPWPCEHYGERSWVKIVAYCLQTYLNPKHGFNNGLFYFHTRSMSALLWYSLALSVERLRGITISDMIIRLLKIAILSVIRHFKSVVGNSG